MASYYAAFLRLEGRRCAVVGGGEVALRKVESLLEAGADVVAIAPALCQGIEEMHRQARIEVERGPYRPEVLDGAFLAIAATNDQEANRQVAADARERRVLVNVVDDPQHCDFIVPSVVQQGDLMLAISTGGRSPAMARWMRERLDALIGPEYGELLGIMAEARAECRGVPPERWQEAASDEVLQFLREGKVDLARQKVKDALVGQRG